MFLIEKTYVPANRWREVTYGRVVVDYRSEKSNTHQTRIKVGGDRVNYLGYCGTPTVDLTMAKILLNIIVLKPTAKSMAIDVKYFYLNTTMLRSKYMRLKLRNPPKSVVKH